MARQIRKLEQAFQFCLSTVDAHHSSIISPNQLEMSQMTTADEMRGDVGLSFLILLIVETLTDS